MLEVEERPKTFALLFRYWTSYLISNASYLIIIIIYLHNLYIVALHLHSHCTLKTKIYK